LMIRILYSLTEKRSHMKNNWQNLKLDDVLQKMEGGGTPSKAIKEYWGGDIPWATVKDITTFNPDDTQDHITEEGLNSSSTRLVHKGTLITPTRMALGHVVFFNVDVTINQDLKALYPKDNTSKHFLFYWFKYRAQYIKSLGNGSTVDGIPQTELKAVPFSLPPLPEQHRIVTILETWDNAIDLLKQKIELKKQVKKGLMQQLLTGNVRLHGFNKEWKMVNLDDVCEFKKGSGLSKGKVSGSGKYKCILYGEIYTTYNEYIKDIRTFTNFEEGTLSKQGDILIPASTTTSHLDLATATTVFEDDVLLGGDINILRRKDSKMYDSVFLSLYLTHVQKHGLARFAQGVTIVHLYGSHIKKLKIKIPSIEEQKAIVAILITADNEITFLELKLHALEQQKKFLLNNLVTGEIRTPEDMTVTA
jgi:type I restriction enzyme, S subunit